MSKKKKPGFIQLYWSFYDSQEWRRLHWYSKLVYLRIKRKYNPNTGNQITVSYREMADEMTRPTVSKAIKELSQTGFIDVEQKGGLYRKRNYYTLSSRWCLLRQLRVKIKPIDMVDIHKGQ
jgi:DNA-binding transcriptional ArsR family regulator